MKCSWCNGSGYFQSQTCMKCNGRGTLPEFETGGLVVTAGGVGKVEVSGVFVPQLTLKELRDQFEDFYIKQNGSTRRRDLISLSTKGNYGFHKAQIMWLSYKACAKVNNILREG